MEPTLNERIWQWLEGHKQEFFDWWASQTKDASQLELVAFDPDRHVGALMTYMSGGVRKVVNVSPSSLVEGLAALNDEIRQRCLDAAILAEDWGAFAKEKGETAATLNARAEELISEMEAMEHALDEAEQGRVSAEAAREIQESRRQQQEQQRENLFLNNEALRQEVFDDDERRRQQTADLRETQCQDTFDANELHRQETADLREAQCQNVFDENENNRQRVFEEAENERMQAILLTKFYIDPDTMDLHVLQVEPDRTQYSINDNGELIARFEVED
jgi:hypothetical protein